jgi:hypothetical protein
MVYYPKPGIIKEYVCELLADTTIYYVVAIIVAHTGGSLAFMVNLGVVGMAFGFILLTFLTAWPYIHVFPQVTLGMAVNDLICWYRGKESLLYVLRNVGHLVAQLVAALLAALFAWITAEYGAPIRLGMPLVVTTSIGEAIAYATIVSLIFTLIWFWASEMATPIYSHAIGSIKMSKAMNTGKMDNTAQKNSYAAYGQIALVLGSLFRGFVIGMALVVLTFASQPIIGWAFNPMIYLGFAIVTGHFADPDWYVHIFFPLVGAIGGYATYLLLTIANTWRPLTKYYGRNLLRLGKK